MAVHEGVEFAFPDTPIRVYLDPLTGLPVRVVHAERGQERVLDLRVRLSAVVGGIERHDPVGGLQYLDTDRVEGVRLTGTRPRIVHAGDSIECELDAALGPLEIVLTYRLHPTSPYLDVDARLAAPAPVVVRDLEVDVEASLPGVTAPGLHVPGSHARRTLELDDLGDDILGVSPIGGLEGSAGLVCLSGSDSVISVWPNTSSEIPRVSVRRVDRSCVGVLAAGLLSGVVGRDEQVRVRLLTLDLSPGDFDSVRSRWHGWLRRYGLTSPPNKPQWMRAASLYEVQVGPAPFWGGHVNEPYAAVTEVTRDLDRISSLGFSVIQLMPRHPYPSYNVHDYWDIVTTYGDPGDIRELVRAAHERGIRVILDVLLHGVLDQESIDSTVEGVQSGPFADRLDEELLDVFIQPDPDQYRIAWSRHILDFGPDWRDGSPARTPLEVEHPDWFFRDSDGNVTGIYTKAFDTRNADLRTYLREALLHLLTELDIDGFRFDAPTYNAFANWAPWSRGRASASFLGCVPLFEDLREDMKAAKPDVLMYTEPSGHLLRRSMDLNYNYDETWLVTALGRILPPRPYWVRSAEQFMQWHEDRDDFLPSGSFTAHHVDSHDSFWWSDWGKKWRREQCGLLRTRALTAAFMSLDGPFMMFTGGEDGIEHILACINGVRRTAPGLWARPGEFQIGAVPAEDLYWMTRRGLEGRLDVLVNVGGSESIVVPLEGLDDDASTLLLERAVVRTGQIVLEPDGIAVLGTAGLADLWRLGCAR